MHTEMDLEKAKLAVLESEKKIALLQRIIDALQRGNQPTRAADKFMLRLRETLQARRDFRDGVAAAVHKLDLTGEG